MTRLFFYRFLLTALCLLLLAGCAGAPDSGGKNVQTTVYPVSCIAVLPAVPVSDPDGSTTPERLKKLQEGARMMNRLLSSELGEHEEIVLAGDELLVGLKLTGGEDSLDMARLVGRTVNCNAVLETTVSRYTERVGTKWSVEQAAAVAFEMRLIGIDAGNIFWSAKFDEEQIPVLENLYTLSKARTRGFTWITAAELMREGLREKLSNSPYFKPVLSGQGKHEPGDDLEDKV